MSPALLAGGVFVILSIAGYALISALNLPRDEVAKRRLQEEEPVAADRDQTELQADSAPLVTRLLRRTRLDDALHAVRADSDQGHLRADDLAQPFEIASSRLREILPPA